MQLLGFACIRDCSVCPFSCHSEYATHKRKEPPETLSNTAVESVVPDDTTYADELTSDKQEFVELPLFDEELDGNEDYMEAVTLPAVQDVQYEVKREEPKLFGLFKRGKK